MSKDYAQVAKDVVTRARALNSAMPEAMAGFGQLGKAAYADGALSAKMKELVALAIGVAARCDGCIAWHAKMALKHGATREEISELLAVCVQMGGGPSSIYAGQALEAYDALSEAG